MRFMGGKGRIAKELSEVILNDLWSQGILPMDHNYVEPFMGGGAMAARMVPKFRAARLSDISPDLMQMWSAAYLGWVPPTDISPEAYEALKQDPLPGALRGFVGFGGSFGGKWFGGYARGGYNADGTPRNHQAESSRAVVKDAAALRLNQRVVFSWADYRDVRIGRDDVVYVDPPYEGTTGYAKPFDHTEFWETMALWAGSAAAVYVSEYKAPPGWKSIWHKDQRSSVRIGSEHRHMTTEQLFTI